MWMESQHNRIAPPPANKRHGSCGATMCPRGPSRIGSPSRLSISPRRHCTSGSSATTAEDVASSGLFNDDMQGQRCRSHTA